MDLIKLEELLKFHGKIPTRSGVIWILRGLLGHFDPGMSVKVKIKKQKSNKVNKRKEWKWCRKSWESIDSIDSKVKSACKNSCAGSLLTQIDYLFISQKAKKKKKKEKAI